MRVNWANLGKTFVLYAIGLNSATCHAAPWALLRWRMDVNSCHWRAHAGLGVALFLACELGLFRWAANKPAVNKP